MKTLKLLAHWWMAWQQVIKQLVEAAVLIQVSGNHRENIWQIHLLSDWTEANDHWISHYCVIPNNLMKWLISSRCCTACSRKIKQGFTSHKYFISSASHQRSVSLCPQHKQQNLWRPLVWLQSSGALETSPELLQEPLEPHTAEGEELWRQLHRSGRRSDMFSSVCLISLASEAWFTRRQIERVFKRIAD